MKSKSGLLVAGIGILLAAMPLLAHHSFSSEYDSTKRLVLKGETPPVNVLYRNGWTKPMVEEMVKKGEMVTLTGQAARDGSNHVFAMGVTREDGKTVLGLSGAPPED